MSLGGEDHSCYTQTPFLSLCSYGKLNHELAEHQPWTSPPATTEENQQKEEN